MMGAAPPPRHPNLLAALHQHCWGWYRGRAWTKWVRACEDCGALLRRDNAHDLCLGIVGELLLDPDETSRVPVRWRENWEERRRLAQDHHRNHVLASMEAWRHHRRRLANGGGFHPREA